MTESIPNRDLSSYTGLSFDVRGQMKGLRVLVTGGNAPAQDHNDGCPFSGASVPACAVGRGTVIPGITDGFSGAAPDLGAFASGKAPWVAGARRTTDPTVCGKIADVGEPLPPQPDNPWLDGGTSPDGGTGLDGGPPDGGGGAAPSGGGCGCRTAADPRSGAARLLAICLLGFAGLRRRRRQPVSVAVPGAGPTSAPVFDTR
jgi:MYXO-CTERM domain-containing protein